MKECRLCGHQGLREIVDLGEVPSIHILSDKMDEVPLFHIKAYLCEQCDLVQMPEQKNIDAIYEHSSIYQTSHLPSRHIPDLVDAIKTFRHLESGLEIACNDGAFLDVLRQSGFANLAGVEPNSEAARRTRDKGHQVYKTYFNLALADKILKRDGGKDFIVARHVLEHIPDIKGFLEAVYRLLNSDGVFVLELPYPEPGFEAGAPNVLWEEHINYFPVHTMKTALARAGFKTVMQRFYTGGALVYALIAQKVKERTSPAWTHSDTFVADVRSFGKNVADYQNQLQNLLNDARSRGYIVALYGAGFRSATTINTMKIGSLIDMVVDDREDLDGLYMPGTSCKIYPARRYHKTDRAILLLLGVGAEHERIVMSKAKELFEDELISLSLVYPGNQLALVHEAKERLNEAIEGF